MLYRKSIFWLYYIYADDLLLLSGSFAGLQKMLDICTVYGDLSHIIFNAKKTKKGLSDSCLIRTVRLFLTYSMDALKLNRNTVNQLSVCWNDVFRKISSFHIWESVKYLQLSCGKFPLTICRTLLGLIFFEVSVKSMHITVM